MVKSFFEGTMNTLNTQSAVKASPFSSLKMNHSAIRVPDLEAAVTWYAEKLDFRLKQSVPVAGPTFAFLYPAADDSFHFEVLAGSNAESRPFYKDLHDSYGMSGWHHIGFQVENVDNAINELKRRGVTIVSEPHDVPALALRVAFFADPWGNLFEMIESLTH
jgi:catechol 2,3-dioxygenase-like lactoylglutathione lyase family enzyme